MDFPVSAQFVESVNIAQLHREARGDNPEWPASFVQTDDGWMYRVDREDVEVDANAVQMALDSHEPQPVEVQPSMGKR